MVGHLLILVTQETPYKIEGLNRVSGILLSTNESVYFGAQEAVFPIPT